MTNRTFSNSCPSEDVLLDYTAGILAPVKKAQFEQHADSCPSCAALRNAQAAVWLSLDAWKPAPVSSGFNRELWRRIDADQNASLRRQLSRGVGEFFHFGLWKRVAPLAVAVALVTTAYVMDHSSVKVSTANGSAVVVSVTEADQIERALDDIQLLDAVDTASAPARTSGVM